MQACDPRDLSSNPAWGKSVWTDFLAAYVLYKWCLVHGVYLATVYIQHIVVPICISNKVLGHKTHYQSACKSYHSLHQVIRPNYLTKPTEERSNSRMKDGYLQQELVFIKKFDKMVNTNSYDRFGSDMSNQWLRDWEKILQWQKYRKNQKIN